MGLSSLDNGLPRCTIVHACCRWAIILTSNEEFAPRPLLMMPQQGCHRKVRCVSEPVMASRLLVRHLIGVGIAPSWIHHKHRTRERCARCFEGLCEFNVWPVVARPFVGVRPRPSGEKADRYTNEGDELRSSGMRTRK